MSDDEKRKKITKKHGGYKGIDESNVKGASND